MYSRMISSVPIFHLLDASNTQSPDVTTKNIPDIAKSPLGVPNRSWLRTAALTTVLENGFWLHLGTASFLSPVLAPRRHCQRLREPYGGDHACHLM